MTPHQKFIIHLIKNNDRETLSTYINEDKEKNNTQDPFNFIFTDGSFVDCSPLHLAYRLGFINLAEDILHNRLMYDTCSSLEGTTTVLANFEKYSWPTITAIIKKGNDLFINNRSYLLLFSESDLSNLMTKIEGDNSAEVVFVRAQCAIFRSTSINFQSARLSVLKKNAPAHAPRIINNNGNRPTSTGAPSIENRKTPLLLPKTVPEINNNNNNFWNPADNRGEPPPKQPNNPIISSAYQNSPAPASKSQSAPITSISIRNVSSNQQTDMDGQTLLKRFHSTTDNSEKEMLLAPTYFFRLHEYLSKKLKWTEGQYTFSVYPNDHCPPEEDLKNIPSKITGACSCPTFSLFSAYLRNLKEGRTITAETRETHQVIKNIGLMDEAIFNSRRDEYIHFLERQKERPDIPFDQKHLAERMHYAMKGKRDIRIANNYTITQFKPTM